MVPINTRPATLPRWARRGGQFVKEGEGMRYQRNDWRGSRPDGLGHPRATEHTAESYRAKFVRPGPNASINRLFRYTRMLQREARRDA